MELDKNINNLYHPKIGCVIVRKSDNKVIGVFLLLEENDSIDNYEDTEITDEIVEQYHTYAKLRYRSDRIKHNESSNLHDNKRFTKSNK